MVHFKIQCDRCPIAFAKSRFVCKSLFLHGSIFGKNWNTQTRNKLTQIHAKGILSREKKSFNRIRNAQTPCVVRITHSEIKLYQCVCRWSNFWIDNFLTHTLLPFLRSKYKINTGYIFLPLKRIRIFGTYFRHVCYVDRFLSLKRLLLDWICMNWLNGMVASYRNVIGRTIGQIKLVKCVILWRTMNKMQETTTTTRSSKKRWINLIHTKHN